MSLCPWYDAPEDQGIDPEGTAYFATIETPHGPIVVELFPDARYTVLDRPRMPWMIIEERFDGTPFDDVAEGNAASRRAASRGSGTAPATRPRRPVTDLDEAQRRIAELEQEVDRLRTRKALRAANWLGATARRARRALPWR